MIRQRPPLPMPVRRPLALLAASLLFAVTCSLVFLPIPLPYPVGVFFVQALFVFTLGATVASIFFPAKRLTYYLCATVLAIMVVDMATLLVAQVVDSLAPGWELRWELPVWVKLGLTLVFGLVFYAYAFGRTSRRYYGFLD